MDTKNIIPHAPPELAACFQNQPSLHPAAVISQDCTQQQHFTSHQLPSISTRVLTLNDEQQHQQAPQFHFESLADSSTIYNIADIGNLVNEKISIYRHPLFPLLRILFEKCEIATNSIENVYSISMFDHEIKTFITQMAKENKPFFTDDAEVDGLMLKSLQVLRVHLLELEKVNELCKDFCTRYISCLREKLNSENVMQTLDVRTTPPTSPTITFITKLPPDHIQLTSKSSTVTSSSSSQINSEIENFSQSFSTSVNSTKTNDVSAMTTNITDILTVKTTSSFEDITSGFLSKKSRSGKHGILPKSATNVLKAWLFQHLVHPYPSEEEKRILAQKTGLSNLQVNNWFINARRRILQPMLDTSSSVLKNNKKSKQKHAAQKDWTNSIGVYNAYRTEALQQQVTQIGYLQPQSTAMLVNLSETPNQQMVISQPLQFVTQVQELPNDYLPLVQATTTVTSPVVVSLVADKVERVKTPNSSIAS